MNTNRIGNQMNSLLKQNSYLPDDISQNDNLSQELISQLANEVYREDLTPDLIDRLVIGRTQIQKKVLNKSDIKLSNMMDSECDYYFLPGFNKEAASKHVNSNIGKKIDMYSLRKDFPILQRRINGKPLVWLDNAATTQKPIAVMNAISQYYSEYNSNIHRGAHTLAKLATNSYEAAREKARKFINARSTEEIIFVRGTTEAINLVASSYGSMNIGEGDEILLTLMEHHSNIVPWQMLVQTKGAVIKAIPINDRGEIILEEYEKLLNPHTRMVAITHVSNVLGTINPVDKMIQIAHKHGVCVLVDGAQSIPHIGVDVKELDADFYVFSGHKVYGPTGIGVLYGKKALLEKMPPWQRGGGMIKNVSFNETTYNGLPYKFEAGTGNIADAIGLGAALDYIEKIGMDNVERHERELTVYAMEALSQIPGLFMIGTAEEKISVLSFTINGVMPEHIAYYLNQEGIAVRAGHHCAQPALRRFGMNSSARASLGLYNTKEEIDCLAKALLKIAKYYN